MPVATTAAANGGESIRDEYDVAIIGAGLVGLALAAALAREGLSVALIDRENVAVPEASATGGAVDENAPGGADNTDDVWDARVYAISPGSASFLHQLGVWQMLPAERISAIDAMDVRGDDDGAIGFSAYDIGERALAWIVENRALHGALVEAVRVAAGVDVIAPSQPEALVWNSEADASMSVTSVRSAAGPGLVSLPCLRFSNGRALRARLIVGADGLRSWTRLQAGMHEQPEAYGQTAVVANFACERGHRSRAFQWFLPDGGVLAWLPLPGQRISIVWSAPERLAAELLALDAQALSARVGDAGGNVLGALTMITAPARFPLSSLQLATVIAPRLALIGDAAHGVHPLAGQGVNLGFGDAAVLTAIMRSRGPVRDVGTAVLLERYAARRREPVLAMHAVTDGLTRLFGSPSPWVRALRNRGMRFVGAMPPIRRLLAQSALR